MSSTSKIHLEPGSWQEMIHETFVGIYVGAMHSWYFVDRFLKEIIAYPLQIAFGFDSSVEEVAAIEGKDKSLKVVGVGYGRTGTVRSNRRHASTIVADVNQRRKLDPCARAANSV